MSEKKLIVLDGGKDTYSPFENYLKNCKTGESKALETHKIAIKLDSINVSDDIKCLVESAFLSGFIAGSRDEKKALVRLYQEDKEAFESVVRFEEEDY